MSSLNQSRTLRITGLCITLLVATAAYAADAPVRFLYVGPQDNTALDGARQGLDEANLQGKFLGLEYTLDTVTPAEAATHAFDGYIAILSAGDAAQLETLSARAGQRPVFNLTTPDDALRDACLANVLHVIPSRRMLDDAVAQWHRKHPDAKVSAEAWHPDYVKFAGRDLNKRFRKAFNHPMDDYSWSGWAAVKMTSDSYAREGIHDPAAMLAYLRGPLQFDGQKGIEMNFRENGQLRQTLLIIENGHIAGEAPVRGVVDPDDLDSLGSAHCAK